MPNMAYLRLKRRYKLLLKLLAEVSLVESKRSYAKWTAEEIAILKAYYGILPTSIIAKMLGRSEDAIYAMAYRLKLSSNKLPKHLAKLMEKAEAICKT